MKARIIFIFLFTILSLDLMAQEQFISYGRITFEKKTNMIRSLENTGFPEEAKEKMKKYMISNWELFFDRDKSIYKAAKKEPEEENNPFPFSTGKLSNEIYTDYGNAFRLLKRKIVSEDYLLNDSIPHVEWKIMQEVRNIAGYECRKALGIIHDTIYVVAFYTDEILLRGGPEGFNGLPGMILGLAIPRYNTTWFATRIDGSTNYQYEIIPPVTGKKVETDKDFKKLIELFTRYDTNKKEKPEEVRKRLYDFTL